MWPNPQFPADLITFTENIFNGRLHVFVQCNVKGMQSSKNFLNQFENFKSKLKPSGLLYLQEMHSIIDYEKKLKDDFEGVYTFHGSSNSILYNFEDVYSGI